MPKTDNRMRNYKSLEDTRRESGRKRDKRNMLNFRMVVFAVIFFIVATQETEFPTGYLLFAAFIIIIALVVRMVLQKRKASEENPNEEARYRRPVKSEKEPEESGKSERLGERYGEELNGGYLQSKSYADYPDVIDPWDIKDDKPPWEL